MPGIYQVRGLDLSNITFVEGQAGVLVIDPLISVETAAAALALYRAHRGDRPVVGVIYTHSHVDHFGGVKGVTSQAHVDAGQCPVMAPEGFMEHAVAENVYAGPAMTRRAGYMYGAALARGPHGQVGAGLGQTTSMGTPSLIAPTDSITATGETRTIDGIRMEFQLTPGTEAPAEMNVLFPDHRALCMAENTTHVLHNILTIRGAVVRDARVWSRYITEAMDLFGERMDVVFASHHWPTWGRERALGYLSLQRDLYAYLHDQTLRLLNRGLVGSEIAEVMQLPPALEQAWHARGYYGSVSHNVKAIYQRYMGWYDGNPAHLWEHPPVEKAQRYVAAMGGAEAVLARAHEAVEAGDFRWAVEILNHLIFAEPELKAAHALQADAFEQLGFGSENGTWRSAYLAAATELREGCLRDAGVDRLPGHAGRPLAGAALRCHRHPRRWAACLGRGPVARHRPGGHRRELPAGPAQRGPHPPRRTGRWSRPRRSARRAPPCPVSWRAAWRAPRSRATGRSSSAS